MKKYTVLHLNFLNEPIPLKNGIFWLMTPTKAIYIALGSNKGNKLQYLQTAVDFIFEKIGGIKKISKVYTTPALGFEGDPPYIISQYVNILIIFIPLLFFSYLLTIIQKGEINYE